MEILFQHNPSYFVMTNFVPLLNMVILQWMPFWIHPDCTTLRIGFSLVTFLFTSGFCAVSNSNLPTVSYTKAADIYSGTSVTFGFLALLGNHLLYSKKPFVLLFVKTQNKIY